MADQQKLDFLTTGLFEKLNKLNADSKGSWGVMNAQEMVEHIADFVDVSSNRIISEIYTPEEHLPKYMEFLRSDKEFRENTKAPAQILGEKPLPLRKANLAEAIDHLKDSVNAFVRLFKEDPGMKTAHPVFGNLGFDDWVILHHKHVTHHLKQFQLQS